MSRKRLPGDPRYGLIVVMMAVVVGCLTTVYYVIFSNLWGYVLSAMIQTRNLVLVFTMSGLSLAFILTYFFSSSKAGGSGTRMMLETLHLRNGRIAPVEAVVRPAASLCTIGFGGATGLEGSSMIMGGAIGAFFARFFNLSSERCRKMFLAGAASGLASIFKAPLTAILFTLEVPYKKDIEKEAFTETAIAAVMAYLVTVTIIGPRSILEVSTQLASINFVTIAAAALLGILCGLYSQIFVRAFNITDGLGKRFLAKGGFGLLLLPGGLILGIIGYSDIGAIGIGYDLVSNLVSGMASYTTLGLLSLLVLRLLTTVITLNFGGSGGLFFPSIVEGAIAGSLFSLVLFQEIDILYVCIGMAAMLAGTHKVLLAPVAFVAETIGPIIAGLAVMASVFSFFTSGAQSFFPIQPSSKIMKEELALERVYSRVRKTAPRILTQTRVADVMIKDPVTVRGENSVYEALNKFGSVPYRILPIVDNESRPISVVKLEDIVTSSEKVMKMAVSSFFTEAPIKVDPDTTLEQAIKLMFDNNADHIYVVNKEDRLLGVVAETDITKRLVHYYSIY